MTTTERSAPWVRVGGAAAKPSRHRLRAYLVVLGIFALVLLLRWLVVSVHIVESGSMSPTAESGDLVIVDQLSPRWSPIERGELVVFTGPEGRLLKRVVGVAGDHVVIKDAILYVNDEAVDEPYVDYASIDGLYTARVIVPEDHVYVLGDSRDGSVDSREFGPVSLDDVQGRARGIL